MRARAGAAQGGRPIEGSERAAKQRAPVGGGGGADGGASACPHRPSISALHPPHRRRHRPAHRRWVAWGGGGGGGAAETGSAFWLEKKTRASAPPSPGSHCPRPGRPRARPPRHARGRTVRGNKFQPGRVGVGNVEGQRTFFLSFLWDGGRRIEQVGGSARARASPTRKKNAGAPFPFLPAVAPLTQKKPWPRPPASPLQHLEPRPDQATHGFAASTHTHAMDADPQPSGRPPPSPPSFPAPPPGSAAPACIRAGTCGGLAWPSLLRPW